ncbi:MAG: DinB family protein [Marmoricola sp.]
MSSDPIEPDTKDWTWVLERPCPECGFEAERLDRDDLHRLLRDNTMAWVERLSGTGPEVARRPDPTTWSPLEYACHVRDVHRIFDERVTMMLREDNPRFPNWDQDGTAVEDDYAAQDASTVAVELVEAAGAVAGRYAAVSADQWQRRGVRSDGSKFTLDTISRYHAHDVVHHAYDVGLDVVPVDPPAEGFLPQVQRP